MREPGFYWVKFKPEWHSANEWNVAEWDGDAWIITESKCSFDDEDFAEIDERRIVREK